MTLYSNYCESRQKWLAALNNLSRCPEDEIARFKKAEKSASRAARKAYNEWTGQKYIGRGVP